MVNRSFISEKMMMRHSMMKGKRILREKKAQNYLPYEDCCCLVTHFSSVHSLSRVQLRHVCHPMECSMPGLPVHHQLQEFTQFMFIELVMPSNHLIFCHPLLLPPSIFPSIRVFSLSQFFTLGGQSIGFQLQHQTFQ